MNILVYTTLFPNAAEPIRGVFVKERVRHFTANDNVAVVVPVSFISKARGWIKGTPIPDTEVIDGLVVRHPTYFYIPGLFKFLDGIFLFLSSIINVFRLRRSFRFDLIDAHYCYPDGFAAVLLGIAFKVPVVVTIRGNDITLIPRYRLRKPQIVYVLEKADLVIAVSHWLHGLTRALLNGTKNIHVVMNSVDHSIFMPMDKKRSREAWGIPQSATVILSVGALIERKGFHHIIRAIHAVRQEHGKDLLLYIAGGPGGEKDFGPTLRKLVADLGLDKQVIFLGLVQHRSLVTLYNAADLFCLFSEREGCPNVLMEALACGVPAVIAGDWVDRTMLPSDDVGYISQSKDTEELAKWILKALMKSWDREKIRAFSVNNSWEKVGNSIHTLFGGLIQ